MQSLFPDLLFPLLVLAAVLFLAFRLRLFSEEELPGKVSFILGGAFLVLAAGWQVVKSNPAYPEWFLEPVYFYLDIAQYSLFALGVLLVVVGISLYADFWEERKREIEHREQKLSILDDLQRDAREPYQLLDLLNLSLKGIIAHLPECAGALFLLNRNQRQFVLASSVGLTKEETASLEYYPLERNIVSQAVDLGDPLIAGGFDFIARDGTVTKSRFASCLVLPLISGNDKLGGIILFSQQERYFGNAEIRYLMPVAEWLAEKIKSTRLVRELSLKKSESERQQAVIQELFTRFLKAVGAFSVPETVTEFCRSLVGLAEAQSVHLIGLVNGSLHLHGGSEPLEPITENYKTALVDAVNRQKPLIVNQEGVTEEGQTYLAYSSLIFPLGVPQAGHALLFRKEGGAFKVSNAELKHMEIFAHLAAVVLEQEEARRLDVTRRKGFHHILHLLRFERLQPDKKEWQVLVRHFADILPASSAVMVFGREADGRFTAWAGTPFEAEEPSEMSLLPGEGDLLSVVGNREPLFLFGKAAVDRHLESFGERLRERWYSLFDGRRTPVFLAACPVSCGSELVALVYIFIPEVGESERREWERLITLSVELFSMRLTVGKLLSQKEETAKREIAFPTTVKWEEVKNALNNHLSAVIGNAELVSASERLPQEFREQVERVISEAERAAALLKQSLDSVPSSLQEHPLPADACDINDVFTAYLASVHVSDNLYMIGGTPREINTTWRAGTPVAVPEETMRALAEEALNRFASLAPENEVITVATYRRDDAVYLDISRHQRNFPSVEPVAGFGEYQPAADVLHYRPADTFLRHLVDKECLYSFDRFAHIPSYISFRFPLKSRSEPSPTSPPSPKARILAIDDQPVILDLISAMCRSLGCEAVTASSGEEGLARAAEASFDIVLTDLAMPDMSGLEVARQLRRSHPRIPIILVTGWEAGISQAELDAAGIADVLYKPFRIEQLTEIIRSAISSRSLS